MLDKYLISFVYDLIQKTGKDFFEKSSDEKNEVLQKFEFDVSCLLNLGETEFLKEMKLALEILSSDRTSNYQPNKILEILANYTLLQVIPVFDRISIKFFIASFEEKKGLLAKLFEDNSKTSNFLKDFLEKATNEEVQKFFRIIITKAFPKIKTVIIQSASECPPVLKTEIRNFYKKDSFVTLQVNKSLLGGMLVYEGESISDSSWLGKVNALKKFKRDL